MNIQTAQSLLKQQPGVKTRAYVSLGHTDGPSVMILMSQVAIDVDGIRTFNSTVDQLKALYARSWGASPVVTDVHLVN